jgi:hypothetical protein
MTKRLNVYLNANSFRCIPVPDGSGVCLQLDVMENDMVEALKTALIEYEEEEKHMAKVREQFINDISKI